MIEHPSGDATDQPFAETAMPISAEHEIAGFQFPRGIEQGFRDRSIAMRPFMRQDGNAVPREIADGMGGTMGFGLIADGDHVNGLGVRQ